MWMEELSTLLGTRAAALALAVAALLARLAPAIWIAPFLGGRLVPAIVKPALGLALALVLYPAVLPDAHRLAHGGAAIIFAVLVKELFVGLALGFVASILFWAAQSAGWLADASRGASFAETLVPQVGERSSPLGNLQLQLAVVLFLSLGGHRLFVAALGASYAALPLGAFPDVAGLRGFALLCGRLSADLVLVALGMVAPVVAALWIADVALGWINRFAAQVNVFFLAMPFKAMLGLGVLALALSVVLASLPPLMDSALGRVQQALDLLGRQ